MGGGKYLEIKRMEDHQGGLRSRAIKKLMRDNPATQKKSTDDKTLKYV